MSDFANLGAVVDLTYHQALERRDAIEPVADRS